MSVPHLTSGFMDIIGMHVSKLCVPRGHQESSRH